MDGKECPACGSDVKDKTSEVCHACGVVFAKFDPSVRKNRDELKAISERRLYRQAVAESRRVNAEEAMERTKDIRKIMALVLKVFLSSMILGLLIFNFWGAKRSSSGGAPKDWQLVTVGQNAVLAHLKDPGSAMFRNVAMGKLAVCGEVNSKNSFGGFGGYQRFVASASMVVLEYDTDMVTFREIWAGAC